jgi:hypothetical protein
MRDHTACVGVRDSPLDHPNECKLVQNLIVRTVFGLIFHSCATERYCYAMKKVAEVLEGLREEERRLSVELAGVRRAIAALEEVMGIVPAQVPALRQERTELTVWRDHDQVIFGRNQMIRGSNSMIGDRLHAPRT